MQLSRRTILKSLAAVVMAPTVALRKTVDREAILRAFCDDEESIRYGTKLMAPIVHDDHVWATNAREMIRAVDFGFERDGGEAHLPPLTKTWEAMYRPEKFTDFHLPRIEELTHRTDCNSCPLCDDRRVSYGDHYPTDYETVENLPDYDPDDNTIRDKSCPLCRGRNYNGPSVMLIGGQPFRYARLKKLSLIPNCRVSVIGPVGKEILKWQGPSPVLCFAGDGFQGMAMPLVHAEKV